MSKKIKATMVIMSSLTLIILLGCAAVMDLATPCFIEPDAAVYADENITSFLPFTTLWDAEKVDKKMDYAHQIKQLDYARLMEDDVLKYGFLKNAGTVNMQSAAEFQKVMFTPEGPIGLLIPMLSGGTLGALLIKRPGDKKADEKS